MQAKMSKPAYTDLELKQELSNVFKSVYFVDKWQKLRLQQSYFMNFDALVDYARGSNIDEKKYIRSIRRTLLKSKYVYKTLTQRPKWIKPENVR